MGNGATREAKNVAEGENLEVSGDDSPLYIGKNISYLRIIMIGEYRAGKTCIMQSLVGDEIQKAYRATIGIDFSSTKIEVYGKSITVQLWDSAGQERFRCNVSYAKYSAVVIVVDITSPDPIYQLKYWVSEVRKKVKKPKIYLIGNKLDLADQRLISSEKILEYASLEELNYVELSASDKEQVDNVFKEFVADLLEIAPPSRAKSARAVV